MSIQRKGNRFYPYVKRDNRMIYFGGGFATEERAQQEVDKYLAQEYVAQKRSQRLSESANKLLTRAWA